MSLQYSKFGREDGTGNVTLFHDGEIYGATNDHPNWDAIVAGVEAGDESVVDLFDVSRAVAKKFEALSERVRVANGRVYFDGDEVNNTLTQQIVRFMDSGEDFEPLVKFYERLALNPNQESVEQLYRWLNSHEFTITSDGKIIGYKGVESDGAGGFRSVKTGTAIVNGEEQTGQISNNIGDVVEMPRSAVTFDPDLTCSYGLHIGTWNYAQNWGRDGAVLKVLVDPRDVVSVPSDSSDQKLRACRYTVLEVLESEIKTAVDSYYEDDEDDGFPEDYYYDGDDDGEDSVVDVTASTVVSVDQNLPWPSYCPICNGPCQL
jgi:hypothetical protein